MNAVPETNWHSPTRAEANRPEPTLEQWSIRDDVIKSGSELDRVRSPVTRGHPCFAQQFREQIRVHGVPIVDSAKGWSASFAK